MEPPPNLESLETSTLCVTEEQLAKIVEEKPEGCVKTLVNKIPYQKGKGLDTSKISTRGKKDDTCVFFTVHFDNVEDMLKENRMTLLPSFPNMPNIVTDERTASELNGYRFQVVTHISKQCVLKVHLIGTCLKCGKLSANYQCPKCNIDIFCDEKCASLVKCNGVYYGDCT